MVMTGSLHRLPGRMTPGHRATIGTRTPPSYAEPFPRRVLEHRVHLTPLRKLWIAWSAARRERRIAKRTG